ncbi:hypothetical protein ASPSYDRAFT_55694 [Aspergillus sydowii CBS 593.65]|uniref:N-acetyltransferase domain-containing protein n=1 Tax=Aspergillus sydowii CBS 593.65 TaxID=1036612 RepID=A0A1L9TU84_9EURO|nr:uncharacterized protein ASPSYDRAFT_55694 [Aspergillus sydowii CBS 593.65]OJJ62982.1 hypothetical protein ASPSYDRAFT_55694 [Aspergillus sydowii CBS 593.65]
MTQPILQLPKSRCLIRQFDSSPAEEETLSAVANNPRVTKYMTNAFPSPYTIPEAQKWIAFTKSQSPVRDFAICDAETNSVIGTIGLKPKTDIHHRTMELGYWVGETHWGRGIATEAVKLFSAWAFANFEHLVRLEAEVIEGNDGSRKVVERAGYIFEGRRRLAVEKNGVLLDTYNYSLLREEGETHEGSKTAWP